MPGRPPDDAPNVAGSRGIPTELTKRLGSTILLGQMSRIPKMSAVGYLRIGVGTGMVAGSSVFRDFLASQERFENEWRPREPYSFARRSKARVGLPGPSVVEYHRPLRDRPSLRHNNRHLKPCFRQQSETSPQGKPHSLKCHFLTTEDSSVRTFTEYVCFTS